MFVTKEYPIRLVSIVVVCSLLLPYQYASAAQIPTPVSCWSFDEVSGDAHDAIGSNTLVNQNSMPYTTGKVGGAADIDTHNSITDAQYIKIDDANQSGLDFSTKLSISLWVNFDSVDPSAQSLVSKFDHDTNNESYALVMNNTDHQLDFWADADGVPLSSTSPTLSAAKVWPFSPVVGQWYHIVVSYSNGDAQLYINDVEQTSPVMNALDSSIYNSIAPFEVGDIPLAARESNLKLDELGVWNQALTKNEVKKLYNKGNGVSCSSL